MNFLPYTIAHTVEGGTQTIAQGTGCRARVNQESRHKRWRFFQRQRCASVRESDTIDEFVELLAIVVVPAAFTHTFGRMVGRPRDGWVIFWTMTVLIYRRIARVQLGGVERKSCVANEIAGGNMEGKEVRFGVGGSTLAAVVTSNGATGSYNSMHDSFQPLGVAVPLVNMLLGEIVYGGLGTGLYSMIFVALVALFIGGLMVGRTPEHLGKQIGPAEMKIIASLYAGRACHGSRVDGACSCHECRSCRIDNECWRSWLHRNSVCLCQRLCQQRAERWLVSAPTIFFTT